MPAAMILTPVALALGVIVLAGGGPPSGGPPAPAPAGAVPSATPRHRSLGGVAVHVAAASTPRGAPALRPGPQPWSPGHRGVDLGAGAGAPVLAAGDGRVTFVGTVAGAGSSWWTHGTLRTTYEPVTATMPSGAAVSAGQEIGRLDAATGHCGRACLHWGALRGSVYVDPLLLPGLPGAPGPPVLLPLGAGS